MATGNTRDQRFIAVALQVLRIFQEERSTMPLQYAVSFLLVAQQEGLSVSEYAVLGGVSQTVMTRHLLDIGSHTRKREPGLGLVIQRPDPLDNRRHQAFLTSKGRSLLHKIRTQLETF